ncbi:hypothetical protein ACPOL_0768 [Acidisarcina polymorpha]|uniref:Uncharacterized protein n=1 Tax=Acidisarcina polymorpha TaxID=2211140 RepID=A0A2Z5FTF7_9BACT|nr:hypothetical protein ACPOL_0768 [Acidisarcina polymorpha]
MTHIPSTPETRRSKAHPRNLAEKAWLTLGTIAADAAVSIWA